jgi:hypothetical protein
MFSGTTQCASRRHSDYHFGEVDCRLQIGSRCSDSMRCKPMLRQRRSIDRWASLTDIEQVSLAQQRPRKGRTSPNKGRQPLCTTPLAVYI